MVIAAGTGATTGGDVHVQAGSGSTDGSISIGVANTLLVTVGAASNHVQVDGVIANNLVFEGATPDTSETTFAITDPTGDRTITFPDSTITVNAAGHISGATLAANVVASSLTGVGVLSSGSISSAFGNVDIGSSALTCGQATLSGNLVASADTARTIFGAVTSATITLGGGGPVAFGGPVVLSYLSHSGTNAVPLTDSFVRLDCSGATGYTLADGSSAGQIMYFVSNGGAACTLTPSSFSSGSQVNFGATGRGVTLAFDGANWAAVGISGASIS